MVLYHVYSQEHRIRYLAHPCSTAVLFQIGCLILTFLSPLFTGYFTSGFYYKELTYSEQPNITFLEKHNIIIADTASSGVFSSSDARLNNYFQSIYYPSTLKANIPRDTDGDGIVDQQTISINLILPSTNPIAGDIIQLWLLFQFALNQYPLINMETLGLISIKVPRAISSNSTVAIYGQLRFQQRHPILTYTNDSTIPYSIIDYGTYLVVPSLDQILSNYTSRNYSTIFDQKYVQWSSSASSDGSIIVTIKVVVNTGQQLIRYVPTFWQEFRWSWIQYVTGLLPFFYVANKVKEFVFSNGLVRTVVGKSP